MAEMLKNARGYALRILLWSEQYVKTDMRYLVRGGFWSFISQAITLTIALVTLIALGHFLPQEVYGQYKYVLSFIALISAFSLNGISNAVFQSVSRGYDGALREGFFINLRWSILIFVAALAACAYYVFAGNTVLALGILIGGCCSPLVTSAGMYTAFLSGKKDFARRTLYGDLVANIIPALTLIVIVTFTTHPLIVIATYFLSNALIDLFLYLRIMRLYKPNEEKRDPTMFSFSKHLSVMGVLSGIANNIDHILLFHFAGGAQLALYSFAVTTVNQARGQIKALDVMTQAQFANRSSREIAKAIWHKMFLLAITSIAGVTIYILAAPFLYQLLFPQYVGSVIYSQVYALAFLGSFAVPAGSYLVAKKRIRELYIDNILSYTCQIILMIAGILGWGLWGLIVARVLTRLADAVLVVILYRKASSRAILAEDSLESLRQDSQRSLS